MARRAVVKISVADVEYVAFRLAEELLSWNEPIPPFETRFPHKLESCLFTPFQTYNRKSLYPTIERKAAALFYFMVKNHPFENGNKRIAVTTLLVFLLRNNRWIRVGNQKLYDLAVNTAKSDPKDKDRIVNEVESFIRQGQEVGGIDV